MPIQLSPGVVTTEYDLTGIIPAVSTSAGAIAGIYGWGPVNTITLVGSQAQYGNTFGPPTNLNAETWFTGWNFLSYGNTMYVVRAANTTGATPFATFTSNSSSGSLSNTFIISSGNTNNLTNGMYISQSSNTTILTPGINATISVLNSTTIAVSGMTTNSATALNLYFANPATTYSSIAQQYSNVPIANLVNQVVANATQYYTVSANNFDTNALYIAKYPGSIGNSLRISVCDSANQYSSNVQLNGYANSTTAFANSTTGNSFSGVLTTSIGSNVASVVLTGANSIALTTAANSIIGSFSIGDNIVMGNSSIGYQYLNISSFGSVSSNSTASYFNIQFQQPYGIHTPYTSNTYIQRYWQFYNTVGVAPGQSVWVQQNGNTAANDQLHIVVVDNNGAFTGVPGNILETYKNVSRAIDSQNPDGTTNYYVNLINQKSQYVWWGNDRSGAPSANSLNVASSTNSAPGNYQMVLGADGPSESNTSLSPIGIAYSNFANKENVQIDLVMQGHPLGGTGTTWQLANYILQNVVLQRKDCVLFVSPDKSNVLNNYGAQAQSLVSWVSNLTNSSYVVVDTGYKYQYDQFNNVYRWIPLNGDIAGLCARTDSTNNPWWSPAGFNRGEINNVVRLAYNPGQTDRDLLFTNYINPVVTFPGRGTVLFGDATYLGAASAFNRINVRRLFIVLERAISIASQNYLFEFNDAFTRAQFVNLINPYLRTIQGLRGITDFLVVCDTTNNLPANIDANQFIASIYIKPTHAINFIQLNFVATPTGVQFSQVAN